MRIKFWSMAFFFVFTAQESLKHRIYFEYITKNAIHFARKYVFAGVPVISTEFGEKFIIDRLAVAGC